MKKQVIEHLGQLDFLHAKQNVILLGPSDPWFTLPSSPSSLVKQSNCGLQHLNS